MANTVLELSTAHITEKDNELLGEMGHTPIDEPLNIGNLEYGYAIVLTSEKEYFDHLRKDCEEAGYDLSDSFWKMMQYAFNKKHRVIIIDRDADIIEELEQHDW